MQQLEAVVFVLRWLRSGALKHLHRFDKTASLTTPSPPSCRLPWLSLVHDIELSTYPLLDHHRVMEFTFFPLLFIVKPILMYKMGGMAQVCWTCAFPLVWGYHTTFLVNSASHIWGSRPYNTGEALKHGPTTVVRAAALLGA
jgi:hypothetical protein